MMHAHAIHAQSAYMFVSMSQLFEDVKASRVSYGHTSMLHSRGLLTINQDRH